MDEINDSIYEQREWNVHGLASFDEEDNRHTKFQYARPKIAHIQPPEHFVTDGLEEAIRAQTDGWNNYAASEVSDDEGDPADGRISPCTFARWAEGAQRWDGSDDKYRSRLELRTTFEISVSGRGNCHRPRAIVASGINTDGLSRWRGSDRLHRTPLHLESQNIATARR